MQTFRSINSSSYGTIKEIFIDEGSFVYEWEPLFLIDYSNGITKEIKIGVSGIVSRVSVNKGDTVCSEMTLAIIEEDGFPLACD